MRRIKSCGEKKKDEADLRKKKQITRSLIGKVAVRAEGKVSNWKPEAKEWPRTPHGKEEGAEERIRRVEKNTCHPSHEIPRKRKISQRPRVKK